MHLIPCATARCGIPRLRRAAALLVVAGLAGLVAVTPVRAADPAPRTPQDAVHAFYRWYVTDFRSDHDPLLELLYDHGDDVTPALHARVAAWLDGDAAPGGDYFLPLPDGARPGRDFQETLLGETADRAQVAVALRGGHGERWRLRVTLNRAGDAWRIDAVEREP